MSDQERLWSTLKKEMRSLLMPIKGGLLLAKLEQEYRSMIGKPLPYRALGYQSIMNLVMDMPDVVKLCRAGDGSVVLKAIADESTVGIASLVDRQKSRPKQPPRRRPKCPVGYASHPILSQQTQLSRNVPWRGRVPPTLPAAIKRQLKELLRSSPVLLSDFNKTFAHHFGRPFEFGHFGFFSMAEVLNAASDIITVEQTRVGSLLTLKTSPSLKPTEKPPESEVMVEPNDVKQIVPPVESAPIVDTCSPAPNPRTQNQDQTPSQEFNTLMVQLKPQETEGEKCDKMKQLQKEMKMALAQQGLGGTVSTELKKKIKTIAAQYPEGMLVSKLPGEFEAHFKERLPVRELGFLSLMELVGALSDVLHIECKEGEQDWCIFDIDSQCLTNDEEIDQQLCLSGSLAHEETSGQHERQPCWDFPLQGLKNLETKFSVVTKMVTRHQGLEESRIMQEIMRDEIPPDAVQDRSLYRLPQLDSATLVGVFVEYVVSPSQFYVQIYGAETSEKLEDMMIEMRQCYASINVADRYIMPEAAVKPGHLCCVRNLEDKWWYRGIIHRVLSREEVEVFYLDFGNMGVVPKSYLRLLKDCYANLPAQAVPCSLAQMKPARGDWTSAAILEFQKLCGLKLLVGVVDEYIGGVLYLFLCDTSSEEDIYAHNVLRLEGHAVVCSTNIPSKGFGELNPSTLYLNPTPEGYVALKQVDVSSPQLDSLHSFPGTAHPEPSKDEVHFQRSDEKREDSTCLKPERWAERNKYVGITPEKSFGCQERNSCEDSAANLRPVPKEETLQTKDTVSWCSAPEKPYLEPIRLCTEIWDEDWISLLSAEEEENGNNSNNLRIAAYSQNQTWSEKGSNNESQHNQELESQVVEEVADPLEGTPDSLSQAQDECYISVVHSQQSRDPSQIALDANPLVACNSQPLPALSAFPVDECNGEAPSKTKTGDASQTQMVALSTPSPCFVQGERGCNALVFTTELQGSPVFCIPYNPSAALGASARLAMSGGYFSLRPRKMNL